MARIIDNQANIWGKQLGADGQRSDLWVVDFNQALSGLANVAGMASLTSTVKNTPAMSSGLAVPYVPPKLATYFANTVSLPELKLKSEPIRRDSRPYPMPSWDEPLDPIRMVFWLDCFRPGGSAINPYRSDIYQMLDVWRAIVRAGRNSMSSEYALTLDGNYRINYAYDVRVLLMRPSSNPTVNAVSTTTANAAVVSSVMNDLEFSTQFRLVNCWLGSFKLSELSYEAAKIIQLETVFYAEDIRQEPQSNQ